MPQPMPLARVLVSTDVEVDLANPILQAHCWEIRNADASRVAWAMALPPVGPSPQALFCVWQI
jgi:hypothetical protein